MRRALPWKACLGLVLAGCSLPDSGAGTDAKLDSGHGADSEETSTADSPGSDSDPTDSTGDSAPEDSATDSAGDTDTAPTAPISVVAEDVYAMKLIGQENETSGDSAYDLDMAAAGDVDGDGVVDLIVHLPSRDFAAESGVYYLVSGTIRGSWDFAEAGPALYTTKERVQFGSIAGSAGDVDGDGLDEFMIQERFYDDDESTSTYAGAVWLLDGPVTTDTAVDDSTTAACLVGVETLEFTGASADTGRTVGPAGDTNGDGFGDILISSGNKVDDGYSGIVYLVQGPVSGTLSLGTAAAMRLLPSNGALYGGEAAGDVDGDGLDDIVATQPYETAAAVVVVSGSVRGDLYASDADTVFDASTTDAIDGYLARGVGDINEDGHADLVTGDYWDATGGALAGAVALHLAPFAASEELGTGDAAWIGSAGSYMWQCIDAGDINGDGHPDLAIGASDYGASGSGDVFVEFGPVHSGVGDASDADIIITGSDERDLFGDTLASAGDVDSDGLSDLYVSAPADEAGGEFSGAVYLILGSSLR